MNKYELIMREYHDELDKMESYRLAMQKHPYDGWELDLAGEIRFMKREAIKNYEARVNLFKGQDKREGIHE